MTVCALSLPQTMPLCLGPDVLSTFVLACLDADGRAALRGTCTAMALLPPAPHTTAVVYPGVPARYLPPTPTVRHDPPVAGWWRSRVEDVCVAGVPCDDQDDLALGELGWLARLFPAATRLFVPDGAECAPPAGGVRLETHLFDHPPSYRARRSDTHLLICDFIDGHAFAAVRDADWPSLRCVEIRCDSGSGGERIAWALRWPRVDELRITNYNGAGLPVKELLAALDLRARPLCLSVCCSAEGLATVAMHPAVRMRAVIIIAPSWTNWPEGPQDTEDLPAALGALADAQTTLVGLEVLVALGNHMEADFDAKHGDCLRAIVGRNPRMRYVRVRCVHEGLAPGFTFVLYGGA